MYSIILCIIESKILSQLDNESHFLVLYCNQVFDARINLILVCLVNLIVLGHTSEARWIAVDSHGIVDDFVAVAQALQVIERLYMQLGDATIEVLGL